MPPKGHIVSPEDQAKILVLAVHLDNGHDFVITNMIHKSCRYSYTVGLTRHKIPEILVAGLKQQTAMELLTDIGNKLLKKEVAGELPLYEVRPIKHTVAQDLAPALDILTRGDFQLVQIVRHDKRGRFPWDSECDQSLLKSQPSFWLQ
jgi:hypothetical protein